MARGPGGSCAQGDPTRIHATAKIGRARIEPTEKLVLLALADFAEHDGSNSFPRVP